MFGPLCLLHLREAKERLLKTDLPPCCYAMMWSMGNVKSIAD